VRPRVRPALGALVLLAGWTACAREAISPLAIDPPAAPGAASPQLAPDGDGLLLSWLEPRASEGTDGGAAGHRLRFARFAGGSWSEPRTVAEGDDFFANWADVPAVVRMGDGTLAAHWLAKSAAGTYDYGVRLALSRDGGATWSPAGLLHRDDSGPGEHGFVSWLPEGDGLRAFWLDGREMAGADHHAMASGGAMTLRTARFEPTGEVSDAVRIDERVCDCCQTDAAATARGPLVVYRNRGEGEIRDIEARVRTAGGWSAPVPVGNDGWQIPGCPVNGPAVAADGERAAVAWFTAAPPSPRVRLAFSQDSGASFGRPAEIDAEAPLGRVDLVLGEAGEAVVAWFAGGAGTRSSDRAGIRLRRVAADGRAGEAVTVAATGAARSSGFPRLARSGADLVLVWVDDATPSRLRAVSLPVASLPAPH
jgi:hypothetical protein